MRFRCRLDVHKGNGRTDAHLGGARHSHRRRRRSWITTAAVAAAAAIVVARTANVEIWGAVTQDGDIAIRGEMSSSGGRRRRRGHNRLLVVVVMRRRGHLALIDTAAAILAVRRGKKPVAATVSDRSRCRCRCRHGDRACGHCWICNDSHTLDTAIPRKSEETEEKNV